MNINELVKNRNIEEASQEDQESEIHGERAVIQLVSFLLDDVEYGIDILSVHEILRYPDITRLPNTPPFIKGVINLRGNVIPVVDVREKFGFARGTITDLTRIIVIETGERLVGLLVDNVYQVVRMPEGSIDTPAELIEGVSQEFIRGIGRLKNRLIIILKLENMLFSEPERG